MTTLATDVEAKVLALLRGIAYGELRVFLQGGTITRVERVESIKATDLPAI